MSITSLSFLLFVLILVCVYWNIPRKFRPYILLSGNIFFIICAGLKAFYLLLGVAILAFFAGVKIDRSETRDTRRVWLSLSVALIVGLLLWVRCLPAPGVSNSVPAISMGSTIWLGFSFYSLQAIEYLIWVYKGENRKIEFLKTFSFLAFFPKFSAGPMEEPERFFQHKSFSDSIAAEDVLQASIRILWGFFKKIVIADRLALLAAPIFANPGEISSLELLLGIYALSFQIYCDFSAYCDIAIGVAKLFGYDLYENFNSPYLARSVRDFWHRWHITLTSWFMRHIYLPMGGNKTSRIRWTINIVIVFMASGLWHGIGETFILWGGLHAFYYLAERVFSSVLACFNQSRNISTGKAWVNGLKIAVTFHLVALAWVPFASVSVEQTLFIFQSLVIFKGYNFDVNFPALNHLVGMDGVVFTAGICAWALISFSKKIGDLFFTVPGRRKILPQILVVDTLIILIVFSIGVPGGEFLYVHY